MQTTIKRKFKNCFTMIPNIILNHKNLSLKSKGLCAYLLSKPDDWIFKKQVILSELKEGLDAFNSAIKELTESGFLCKTLIRDKNGYFIGTEYTIYDEPQINKLHIDEPSMENPSMVSPSMENPPYYNNTNDNKTNNIKTKDNKEKIYKKENSYPEKFIEFFKIYEQPKKEIDLQSDRLRKIYQKWKSCKDPDKLIESATKYIEYLDITKQTWSNGGCQQKDIIAWLNANFYEKDWEKLLADEKQKLMPKQYNKQTQEDLMHEAIYKKAREFEKIFSTDESDKNERKPKRIKDVDDIDDINLATIPF